MKWLLIAGGVVLLVLLALGGVFYVGTKSIADNCVAELKPKVSEMKKANPDSSWDDVKDKLKEEYVSCLKKNGFPGAERQSFMLD